MDSALSKTLAACLGGAALAVLWGFETCTAHADAARAGIPVSWGSAVLAAAPWTGVCFAVAVVISVALIVAGRRLSPSGSRR